MTLPDIDSLDSYGGALVNDRPIDDPTTQRDAGMMNAALESVAGMTHTVARAWVRVVLGTSPALASTNGNDANWGSGAPPTPAHSSTGVYTLTFPATVTDELGVVHNLSLRWVQPSLEGSTFGFIQGLLTSANVVEFFTGNAGGSSNDLSGVTALIMVG